LVKTLVASAPFMSGGSSPHVPVPVEFDGVGFRARLCLHGLASASQSPICCCPSLWSCKVGLSLVGVVT